jgi:hypothetical protein
VDSCQVCSGSYYDLKADAGIRVSLFLLFRLHWASSKKKPPQFQVEKPTDWTLEQMMDWLDERISMVNGRPPTEWDSWIIPDGKHYAKVWWAPDRQ